MSDTEIFVARMFFQPSVSSLYPLASCFLMKNKVNLRGLFTHDESLLSCCFQFSLFFGFQWLNYDVSRYGSLLFYFTWSLLSFLNVCINVFPHIWEVFSNYFFSIFSIPLSLSSPSGTPLFKCRYC